MYRFRMLGALATQLTVCMQIAAATAPHALAEDYSPESIWLGHWIFDKTATAAADRKSGTHDKDIRRALGSGDQSFIDVSQGKFHWMSTKGHLLIDCQWEDFKDEITLLKCVDDTGTPSLTKQAQVERVEWQEDDTLHLYLRNGGILVYQKQ